MDANASTVGVSAIGKNTQIPNGAIVGRAAQVDSDIAADRFPRRGVADGQYVDRKDL